MHRKYDSIAISIKVAEMRFETLSNRLLASYDLTGSQFKILKYVCRWPESSVRQVDIEQYFELRNPTVTLMLQKMDKLATIYFDDATVTTSWSDGSAKNYLSGGAARAGDAEHPILNRNGTPVIHKNGNQRGRYHGTCYSWPGFEN